MTTSPFVEPNTTNSLHYCAHMLTHVSRSFALGINTLKGSLRKSVLVGYLLCRIADTIEDDLILAADKKVFYLEEFLLCFIDSKKIGFISSISSELQGDAGHINLVKNIKCVMDVFYSLHKNTQFIILKCVKEMTMGMVKFIKKYPHGIRVATILEYKEYCYYVAGTVGYMLTDLWKEHSLIMSGSKYQTLTKSAGIFGEALQSINILKDIAWDFEAENAIYIPSECLNKFGVNQEQFLTPKFKPQSTQAVAEIIELADNNMLIACEYVKQLPYYHPTVRFFCAFPLLLALATLREIKKSPCVLNPPQKIKVTRPETQKILKGSFISSVSNHYFEKCVQGLE